MEQKKEYTCFFISPIGESDSPERKNSEIVLKMLILHLKELGFPNIVRADKELTPGRNTKRMVQHIKNDDLCIVDMTGWNANVMYEWGMRDAVGKPAVVMASKGTKIPYDVYDNNVIFYDDPEVNMLGFLGAMEEVRSAVRYWVDQGFKDFHGEENNADANKLYLTEELRQAIKGYVSEALREDVGQVVRKELLGPLLQSRSENISTQQK